MIVVSQDMRFSMMPDKYITFQMAVARTLEHEGKRSWIPLRFRKRDYFQLNLNLGGI